MSVKKKIIIAAVVVVVLGGLAIANFSMKRTPGLTVTTEKVEHRDLEAIVSASGKIQPKRSVNISAETMGKVVDLRVNEGDLVKAGQPLLQIDPRNLETRLENTEASLATAKSQLEQTKAQVENSRVSLKQAQDTLKRAEAQMAAGLIPRQEFERAQNDVATQTTNLKVAEQSVLTQAQRIKQEEANVSNARLELKKVGIVSPIDGIVTRRNIEEGETAVVGTMNNAGTVLLTIADLSVIETEIEVDETNIPDVRIGQPAKVTIDAIPNQTFPGKVTEVGNSPIQVAGQGTQRATNFKVTITIDGLVPNVRPGFTCTAVVTTATRQKVLAVPIQAMTVREMIVDADGKVVMPETPPPGAPASAAARRPVVQELKPGQTRKEMEGVFLAKDGRAQFVPVKTGIAGEKYFEVLDGLKEGDEVITGPFSSVRGMKPGDIIKATSAPPIPPGKT